MIQNITLLILLFFFNTLPARIKTITSHKHTSVKNKNHVKKIATATDVIPSPIFYKNIKPTEELRFVFIVPSYNNALYCHKNILSMITQHYKNFHIIYIDDASTDGTATLVEGLIQEHNMQEHITLIKNATRQGIMANRYKAVHLCENTDICLALDGDDWLPHTNILTLFNKIYSEPDVWVTYGRYISYPELREGYSSFPVPKTVLEHNSIRQYPWSCSHLKTFRAWLFKLINVEDLKMNGAFIPAATDLAMMFPMIEMARYHSFFVRELTCVYNNANPLGVIKQKNSMHFKCNKYLRSKKRYRPLKASPC